MWRSLCLQDKPVQDLSVWGNMLSPCWPCWIILGTSRKRAVSVSCLKAVTSYGRWACGDRGFEPEGTVKNWAGGMAVSVTLIQGANSSLTLSEKGGGLTYYFTKLTQCIHNWRIPGTGEPGGLPSMGSHRVGHDWSNLTAAAAAAYTQHTQKRLERYVHLYCFCL